MAKRNRLPCFGPECRTLRPDYQFFCDSCYRAIPGWLRRKLAQEKEACRAIRTKHTQELLKLRDMAIVELTAIFAKAQKEADA